MLDDLNLNRTALAVRLQGAINNFESDVEFLACLSRQVGQHKCSDLTEEEQFVFVEMKSAMLRNDTLRTRQFARQLINIIPRPPFAEKTNLKLNWVMAICGILGVLGTAATLLNAEKPPSGPAKKSGFESPSAILRNSPSNVNGVYKKEEYGLGGRSGNIPPIMRIIHPLQLAVVVALAFVQRRLFDGAGKQFESSMVIATQTLVQFRRGWQAMWWAWAVLYAWFTLSALVLGEGIGVLAVEDVINSVTGLAVWWCFLALDLPSVNLPQQQTRDHRFRRAVTITAIVAFCCAFLACTDRYFDLRHFGVATVGIFNGLGLACLAGRFTSHWMRLPRWQILFIYSYAMMQLIYPFFDILGKELWEPAVYMAVLMMKVMLAYTLRCATSEGGLDNYLAAAQAGLLGFAGTTESVSAVAA